MVAGKSDGDEMENDAVCQKRDMDAEKSVVDEDTNIAAAIKQEKKANDKAAAAQVKMKK